MISVCTLDTVLDDASLEVVYNFFIKNAQMFYYLVGFPVYLGEKLQKKGIQNLEK